jgi:hypothetical protein
MCFSPTASFTAGAALTVIGCVTIGKTKRLSEIPFAAIPLLFGVQQLTEGVIWLNVGTPSLLLSVTTFIFLLFSHVIWPVLLPTSVFLLEQTRWRRWVLAMFILLGVLVSAYFSYYLFTEHIRVDIVGGCISYTSLHFFKTFVLSPYAAATCASCLFSSHRIVNLFGVVAFLAAVVASQFYQYAFVSVWCFFSAILSIIIYLHFYFARR